ncbi:MAG: hypothetical protein SFX73_05765 [Kofleriaceae bacterium]|nr:hypothetical protein [Kofleriaceae bacterium]
MAIDEHGDRRFALLVAPAATARDSHPALSPDGAWVVFASSRDRSLDSTSLWIAPVGPEATPIRLTEGAWIDAHPTWTRDGTAIVFASTRDGGDFDLWMLPIVQGRASGPPVQLTSGPGHEVTPNVAADGSVLYAAVSQVREREVESHLEERAPDGSITVLTKGPTDGAPALSPDETTIAFSRAAIQAAGPSAELWRMGRHGEQPTPIIALPITEESGPVWSRDGRFVFATSILRGEERVLFSSVIHVDLRAAMPIARMLRDRAGTTSRLTPAIAAAALDASVLEKSPEYLPELARIVAAAVEQQRPVQPDVRTP